MRRNYRMDSSNISPELIATIEAIVARTVAGIRDIELVDATGAAVLIYGRPAVKAFTRLRQEHPDLQALAIGPPRLYRWRRGDLLRWVAQHRPRLHQAKAAQTNLNAP